MNKLWMFASLMILPFLSDAQTNIAAARNYAVGQTVTIKGVVTNGSELGTIRYVQDATGALPAYGSTLNSVSRGDSITVTGVLFDYQGLLEISPTNSFTNHGAATQGIPTPLNLPITSVDETKEAQLVRLDNVTFTTTGNFATGNSTVQVTDGTNTLDVRINGTTNIDGTAIPTGPVSIIALVGQFNANYQLIPRDLNDIFAYVPPAREINVTIGGTTYLSGSQYVVGTTAATTVTIENLGSGNLTVSGAVLSGTNAADYSTPFTNAVIAGGTSTTLTLNFAPAGTGSRFGTLTVSSDDSDEASYVINLYGIGTNNLATEPAANPTGLTFPTVDAYTFSGSFTPSASTENYVVLWSNGAAVTGVPVDGTTYQRGDIIGNAKVAYVGPAVNFSPRHVIANQNYHVAVYSFNGPASFENYQTTTPLTGSITTLGLHPGTYYNGINSTSSTFLTNLNALINPHTVISYTNYKPTVMAQFEVRDTTNGQSFVVCSYTGEKKVFNDPFDWTAAGYSREHSYCHSWMPTYPADNPAKPEYSDQHNLYPVNQNNANAIRSNLPMDEITGNVVYTYLDGRAGYNGSQLVYEPRDEQKGNCARAMFYMATCYNGVSGNNWALPTNQSVATLKNWHFADLPDNYEMARQEYIYSVQGNRNPYVDSVNFVCHVDFSNMTYLVTSCNLGVNEQLLEANFVVFPVPTSGKLYVQVNGTQITDYSIYGMDGKVVASVSNTTADVLELNTTGYAKGSYLITVTTPFGTTQRTFIVE